MTDFRVSRVALVIIKVIVRGRPYFLMRKNKLWGDVTFIGGHVEEQDGDSFLEGAHRELLEEVPTFKRARGFELKSLTPQLTHGPVESPSAGATVVYDLQFFLVVFRHTPDKLIGSLGTKSLNVLVSQSELLEPQRYKVATLVELLNSEYQGGLPSIPYSWPRPLQSVENKVVQPALLFR